LCAADFRHPGDQVEGKIPFDFCYSTGELALWLVIVAVLSALASLWPVLRATRVSMREALADT